MPIDANAIAGMFSDLEGFHHPQWPQIIEWLKTNVGRPTADSWNDVVRIWLNVLCEDLGGHYALHEDPETFLLSDLPADAARRLQKFATDAISQMRDAWPRVAWEGSRRKIVILLFSESDDYYSYISYFHLDGDAPQSSGVWLSNGYTHIAAQLEGEVGAAVTILHELCHDAFGHLNLPLWLNEAMARTLERRMAPRAPSLGESETDALWGDVSGWKAPIMWAELADLHFGFWNSDNIQEFWSGHSFQIAGNSMDLSYSLAEVLLKLITEKSDQQSFVAFLTSAGQHNDAGLTAAHEALGLDLGDIAATFLGTGDWRPNRKRIAELNAASAASGSGFEFDFIPETYDSLRPVEERPNYIQFAGGDDSSAADWPATTSALSFPDPHETIEFNSGLNNVSAFDVEALRAQLEQCGYAVFVLPANLDTRRAIFEAIRSTLPLDPPLQNEIWDALSDSLFYGLLDHPSQRLAILWPSTRSPSPTADVTAALEILSDVALGLLDSQTTRGKPKHLAIITNADVRDP
ncbi:MAG TPA: hypothetical protein VM680_04750 [Verrucomicrobiae bacterium]|nr:hypothetical protein [Verrucomicrobiae bacterium]